jgi:RecA/RadA recombinase
LSDREKALEVALTQIEKEFGKGSIMRLGESGGVAPVEAIPTGAISLDIALGVGGMPRGRVAEIYGPESSGKTTVALHIIAEAQKLGGIAAFIDAEHALDATYARRLGVDIDNLLVSQPDTGEQALEITEALVRSGAIDVVVVDSVAALVPRSEIEGEADHSLVPCFKCESGRCAHSVGKIGARTVPGNQRLLRVVLSHARAPRCEIPFYVRKNLGVLNKPNPEDLCDSFPGQVIFSRP